MSRIKKKKKVKKIQKSIKKTDYQKKSVCNEKNEPTFLNRCFLSLRNRPIIDYVLLLLINFLLGLEILFYTDTFKYFFPHLICLTINILITLKIGKKYIHTLYNLKKEVEKFPSENIELKGIFGHYYAKAMHNGNLIACIIVLVIFFWGIFSQQYITTDLVGFYAVFIVSISVSISVIGYAAYIWILWFLYKVSKCSCLHYNKLVPAYTPFLVQIATLLQHAKWCFLIEGFLYTFEYFILIPKENITSTQINMPDNFSFIITWLIVLIVIVLAFPIIVFLQENLLAKIVSNLKNQQIEHLSYQYEALSQNDSIKDNTFNIFIYHEMISKLVATADYPLKIQRLGPTLVSIATICLHTVTLLNQLPQLEYLFNR